MKAFLLAAGVGSRLRPITDTTPKCMVPIAGKPMLDIWLETFEKAGVNEVLVNTHYLPDVVTRHLAERSAAANSVSLMVRECFEPELLGSAGTLVANRDWVEGEEFFLACNADNLTDFDLGSLISEHSRGGTAATLAVFRVPDPTACGVIETDSDGMIIGFEEKPSHPVSDLANAGIYAFSPSVLDEIKGELPKDIGYDLLPQLVGRTRAVLVDGYFRDIGTPAAYERAQEEWVSQ